jgi:hypothetical protein
MAAFVESMQNSPVDERDTLIDAIDALENEPCDEVADAAARLARRYLDGIADLTDREHALLTAAVEQDSATTGPSGATCSLALAGFFALWLRIRETR